MYPSIPIDVKTTVRMLSSRRVLQHMLLSALCILAIALSPAARAVCRDGCFTNDNTVLGDNALLKVTTGNSNTAVGVSALTNDTTGSSNTAVGFDALGTNTSAINNTAIGSEALESNTTGNDNTDIGTHALNNNTTDLK